MRRLAALLVLLLWPAVAPGWDLDPGASSLSVVSVKNGDVAETHRFTGLTGAVAENGVVLVAVALGSIETGIAIRDERMRTMLFDLTGHPFALVSTRVDLAGLEATAIGAIREIAVPLRIEAHGAGVATIARLTVERVGRDRVVIATAEPVLIDARRFGFGPGIEALREIAGLEAIAPALPVSA
jgi:polyisoprenoid-binding protein YceI